MVAGHDHAVGIVAAVNDAGGVDATLVVAGVHGGPFGPRLRVLRRFLGLVAKASSWTAAA